MTLAIYPQPSLFDADTALVRSKTPVDRSSFYLSRPYYIPWTVEESLLVLETDEPDQVHTIVLNRTSSAAFVPGEVKVTVGLNLQKGANRIEVSTPTKSTVVTVAATAVESWLSALGREYYLTVGKRLRDIQDHLKSPWTTRISAHLLPFSDLFLPARMPKIHQTRLAVMTSVGNRLGHGDGVINIATALTYTTPYVSDVAVGEMTIPGLSDSYPGITTHPTSGEYYGKLIDLWTHNQCLASSQALMKFVLGLSGEDVPTPKPVEIIDKNDRQMLLRVNGGPIEPHFTDPMDPQCDDIVQLSRCNSDVVVSAETTSIFDIVMSSPQLALDVSVTNPLNFGFFDTGNSFDASNGSGVPGLGGTAAFDTVDPDDPFGDGFVGVPLSRRLDFACFDTRIKTGQRISKFVAPIKSSSPPALTPEPPLVEGDLLVVDAGAGAPVPSAGSTKLWAVSDRLYMYIGDRIRFENPDLETSVVSAWPVLLDTNQIVATDSTVTFSSSPGLYRLTAPTKFFTPLHEGYGVQLNGTDHYCIVSTSDDGVQSYAVLSGNAVNPGAGPHLANVYNPLRDRSDTSEPVNSTLTASAGRPTYEIVTSNVLLATLSTGHQFAYRAAPRVSGAVSGGSLISISSDVKPDPGDLLYWTPLSSIPIKTAIANGSKHPTTGFPIYDLVMNAGSPASGSLTANPGSGVVDGDTFVIGDGVNPSVTFEFDSNGSVVETATLRQVAFTAGDTATQVRDSIALAIANAPSLDITPTASGADVVDLLNDTYGTVGNVAITQSAASLSSISGMSGGTDALPSLADDSGLFVIRDDACWPNGAPVTPLMLIALEPTAFLVP